MSHTGLQQALEKGSLHEIIKAVREFESRPEEPAPVIRIYVLNNHTVDNLRWFLQGLGFSERLKVDYTQGAYDAIMPEVLEPGSAFHRSRAEIVVLSLVLDGLIPEFVQNRFNVDDVTERLDQMIDAIMARSTAIVAANTFLLPVSNAEGIAACKNSHSLESKIEAINDWLKNRSEHTPNFFLVDFNRIERSLGIAQSRDYRLWFTAKCMFTNRFLQAYGREIMKMARALKGKARKCLVLDCDNTLWGGIVGEDGIDGICLDPHQYPGNVYYRFQENVLALLNRGVILGLCSKNNPDNVWEVLETHPHCLIKRSHIAGWRIDWGNKADNIASLAAEFGLSTESFVFVDDDAAECEFVKRSLPDVAVLQVPSNLFAYPEMLFEYAGFDTLAISSEDQKRGEMYQAAAVRKQEREQYADVDEFLASLGMVAVVRLMDSSEIARVAQLTQKTNQFNLTTHRYSEGDIRKISERPDHSVFIMSVKDRFGDLGLTGVLIAARHGHTAHIEDFLMSCRVLGRKLELAFLDTCMSRLEERWHPDSWTAAYRPSKKNQQVADFWDRQGFEKTKRDDAQTSYALQVSQRRPPANSFIQVLSA